MAALIKEMAHLTAKEFGSIIGQLNLYYEVS
jgi:hypothetical protein